MRLVLAAGSTRTAEIEGISAAGATRELMAHTPAIDAEIVTYGRSITADRVPVSPTGCPTPAVLTRAVRETVGFDLTVVDAGLVAETGAPTVGVDARPGRDVRDPTAVPAAGEIIDAAREFGRALPDDELLVGETIPGGTTTALGVLTALGESVGVSSSLAENPTDLKRRVVGEALSESGVEPGDLAGDPVEAIRRAGDPVLATVAGLAIGAAASGTAVTLAGGTQLLAAAALVRHAGVEAPLSLATTAFVDEDPNVDLDAVARKFDLDLTVTDPGFDRSDHVAMARYAGGEGKEGVGAGGAFALADRSDASMSAVRDRIESVYDRLDVDAAASASDDSGDSPSDDSGASASGGVGDPPSGGGCDGS